VCARRRSGYDYHDLPLLFHGSQTWLDWSPPAQNLTLALMRYWSRLAAAGGPNGDGDPKWLPYVPTEDSFLEFGPTTIAKKATRMAECNCGETMSRGPASAGASAQ
jgi:hypothetical protein